LPLTLYCSAPVVAELCASPVKLQEPVASLTCFTYEGDDLSVTPPYSRIRNMEKGVQWATTEATRHICFLLAVLLCESENLHLRERKRPLCVFCVRVRLKESAPPERARDEPRHAELLTERNVSRPLFSACVGMLLVDWWDSNGDGQTWGLGSGSKGRGQHCGVHRWMRTSLDSAEEEQAHSVCDSRTDISETSTGIGETSPGIGETSPGINETSPGINETSPGINETSPGINETSPGIGETFPSIGEISPGIGETFPWRHLDGTDVTLNPIYTVQMVR
ncbi:hypothetical protein NFI96_009267, partial [Prochilodus magdalenae]